VAFFAVVTVVAFVVAVGAFVAVLAFVAVVAVVAVFLFFEVQIQVQILLDQSHGRHIVRTHLFGRINILYLYSGAALMPLPTSSCF